MARRTRVVVEGGLYHEYNRISSGEAVFADPNEAIQFIEIIRGVKSETASMRRAVGALGVERWRQKGTALAEVLNKNPDVVSWWVGEGIRRRLDDRGFAAELNGLDARLSAALIQAHRFSRGE